MLVGRDRADGLLMQYYLGRVAASLSPAVLRRHMAGTFIETGTGWGGGVLTALCAGYRRIYSCEVNEEYCRNAVELFSGNGSVTLVKEGSPKALSGILGQVHERAVIWLDAHSENDPDNPLPSELDLISRNEVKDHVIMIDDRRMWGSRFPCWREVTAERVLEAVMKINPGYRISYEDSMNGPQDILVAETGGPG